MSTGVAATAMLRPDGSLDPSYGIGGIATIPDWLGVNAITVDSSGRYVLGGVGTTALRFMPDGIADSTFGTGGLELVPVGSASAANGIALDPVDGKIVLAGAATIGGRTEILVMGLNP
jgi:hypothetical protein